MAIVCMKSFDMSGSFYQSPEVSRSADASTITMEQVIVLFLRLIHLWTNSLQFALYFLARACVLENGSEYAISICLGWLHSI